jgi:formate dehydrogenase maturation protein FdhE
MASNTITRVAEPVPALRFCPSCKSAETSVSYRNSDGHRYCRCLTCACRFWGS